MAPSKKAEKGTTTTKASKKAHKAIEKPKREIKKIEKDPDAPKRPATSFLLWSHANKNIIKEENQEMTHNQFLVRCSQLWKEMSSLEKKPWTDKYTLAKASYDKRIEEYETSKAIANGTSKRKKSKKDPDAPKKPQPAFFLWSNDNRKTIAEENPSMNSREVTSLCGQVWREMSEGEKQSWLDQARLGILAYEAEMEAYERSKAIAIRNSKPKKASPQKQQQQPPQRTLDESEDDE